MQGVQGKLQVYNASEASKASIVKKVGGCSEHSVHGEHVSTASAVSTGSTVRWDLLESAYKHSHSLGAAFSLGNRALRPRAAQV